MYKVFEMEYFYFKVDKNSFISLKGQYKLQKTNVRIQCCPKHINFYKEY